jgi:hypothetical protein
MTDTITIRYQSEEVTVESVVIEQNIRFRINFDNPIYIEKDLYDDGTERWIEVGAGPTLRAEQIGEMIEEHTEM